jgi:protein SCO1/2
MKTRREAFAAMSAAALGAFAAGSGGKARKAGTESARRGALGGARLPNTTLYTHEGKAVRFYDDLVRGKVVAINMMYATCEGICPQATSNLGQVQRMLGERAGRDVFMYSITLRPEEDTPQVLKQYADMHEVKPGWTFLTGAPADVRHLRYTLGFYDPDPRVDGDDATHTGMVRIGNDADDRWTSAASLGAPSQILLTINHVDRAVARTWHEGLAGGA